MPAALPACRWIRQKASQDTVSSDNVMSLFFLPLGFPEVPRGLNLEGNARSSSFGLQVENSRSQGVLTGCSESSRSGETKWILLGWLNYVLAVLES